MKKYLHQPNLSTIRLVEQKLKKKGGFPSRNQLFLSLDKRIMYPTITTILDYLEESKKIAFKKKEKYSSSVPALYSYLSRYNVAVLLYRFDIFPM